MNHSVGFGLLIGALGIVITANKYVDECSAAHATYTELSPSDCIHNCVKCLGHNPHFGSFTEPTACPKNAAPSPSAPTPSVVVVVAAGHQVTPALALVRRPCFSPDTQQVNCQEVEFTHKKYVVRWKTLKGLVGYRRRIGADWPYPIDIWIGQNVRTVLKVSQRILGVPSSVRSLFEALWKRKAALHLRWQHSTADSRSNCGA
ncbi:hypothetical protein FOXYSP1_21013 [Fusarium oxysporum f. sp. phaseoli]